jgi:hypothetical protein
MFMNECKKMPLKVFVEEYTKILQTCSPDELKAILKSMADEAKPHAREEFIKKLSPAYTSQHQSIPVDLDILDEIDSLKEDILAQGEEEPDWEGNDEDSLGKYEQFVSPLGDLLDKAALLFIQKQYEVAQNAYRELFSIFDIENDYGHGIRIYDVESADLEEARAFYLCSLYMTTPEEKRVLVLLNAMTEMGQMDFQSRPSLQEIINISPIPLPNFAHFLQDWIEKTQHEEKPSHDAWLREATLLLHGPDGLESLAKREGYKRPRVYLDWMRSLINTKKFTEALSAGETALTALSEGQPIRSAIGDLIILCGEYLQDEKIQQEGTWISFKAKPDLPKLIALYEQNQNSKLVSLLQQAIEVIETHRKRPNQRRYERNWEGDTIESYSPPSTVFLLHALLFAGDKTKAFALAKKAESLGWSSGDNPQPLFIAYCLINVTKCSLHQLPPHLKEFWQFALKTSRDSVWHIEGDKNDVSAKLEEIYGNLFEKPCPINQEILEWCLKASQKREEDIVINQHRNAYDRAALLTAACTDTLKITNPSKATEFFWNIQNKFPRHSAFQAELGRINIVKS